MFFPFLLASAWAALCVAAPSAPLSANDTFGELSRRDVPPTVLDKGSWWNNNPTGPSAIEVRWFKRKGGYKFPVYHRAQHMIVIHSVNNWQSFPNHGDLLHHISAMIDKYCVLLTDAEMLTGRIRWAQDLHHRLFGLMYGTGFAKGCLEKAISAATGPKVTHVEEMIELGWGELKESYVPWMYYDYMYEDEKEPVPWYHYPQLRMLPLCDGFAMPMYNGQMGDSAVPYCDERTDTVDYGRSSAKFHPPTNMEEP